ncbi:MAG: hypothetical protein QOJ79_168 [Actinomycetota bacterium]|nr:hypothetical protein [Actinomycetota bacterium]
MSYDPIPTIRREADAFLAAARRGLAPQVPGCPEWTVRELTHHLGSVHRFHNRHVVRGVTEPPQEWAAELPADADLLEWFDDSCNELLVTLRSIDPQLPAWNWARHTPQVAAFWPRRMALETAVHRWDAESAHQDANGIDIELAVDGIDEMLTVIGPAHTKPDFPSGTVAIRPTDTDAAWAVRMAPDTFEVLTEVPAAPDAVLAGTATALLLALWGRDVDYTATGDAALIAVLT